MFVQGMWGCCKGSVCGSVLKNVHNVAKMVMSIVGVHLQVGQLCLSEAVWGAEMYRGMCTHAHAHTHTDM